MKNTFLNCSVCGFRFDPQSHQACSACPLHKGCHLVCCPSCGFTMVDAQRSQLVNLGAKILQSIRKLAHWKEKAVVNAMRFHSLADTSNGVHVRIDSYAEGFPATRRNQLQAYGLMPGQEVLVLQQSPVTVIQIEYVELAIEKDLARGIRVA